MISPPRRIFQLIDSLDPGGAERMAVNLANEFSKDGIAHQLVVSRRLGVLADLVDDQTCILVLGKKSTLDIRAFAKLQKLVRTFRPNVIHAHGTSLYWGLALKSLFPKLTLVWHEHLGISKEVLKKNPRKEIKWIGKGADLVITANQDTQEYWQQQGIWASNKVVFLPNFPVISNYSARKPSHFTFLHLANYRVEKGQKLILKAVKILADQGIDFRVRFVGRVVDTTWRQEIEKLVQDLDLNSYVSLEDEVGDVGKVLAEVHAGLIGSDREGLPVALLEYGLAGLSVVSTRVGQCPDVLRFGELGLLSDPADPVGFAERMKELIFYPSKAADLAQSYQAHVLANYGAAGFMKTYLKLISPN